MNREQATTKVEALLRRVAEQQPLFDLIEEVYVYGSYARGALAVNDLDIEVVITVAAADERLTFNEGLAPLVDGLRAGDPSISISVSQPSQRLAEKFAPILLWRRGLSLTDSLARLVAIKGDPEAEEPALEFMLPQFAAADGTLLADRRLLALLAERGAITVTRGAESPPSEAVPALAAIRSLRHQPEAVWQGGQRLFTLRPTERFAAELAAVLEELNLAWHDLLWEDEEVRQN